MICSRGFLINIHYMSLDGAERALLGLLNALDTVEWMWICS